MITRTGTTYSPTVTAWRPARARACVWRPWDLGVASRTTRHRPVLCARRHGLEDLCRREADAPPTGPPVKAMCRAGGPGALRGRRPQDRGLVAALGGTGEWRCRRGVGGSDGFDVDDLAKRRGCGSAILGEVGIGTRARVVCANCFECCWRVHVKHSPVPVTNETRGCPPVSCTGDEEDSRYRLHQTLRLQTVSIAKLPFSFHYRMESWVQSLFAQKSCRFLFQLSTAWAPVDFLHDRRRQNLQCNNLE